MWVQFRVPREKGSVQNLSRGVFSLHKGAPTCGCALSQSAPTRDFSEPFDWIRVKTGWELLHRTPTHGARVHPKGTTHTPDTLRGCTRVGALCDQCRVILNFVLPTPLSELEWHLLVPYSTKANAFCELGRKKIGKNEPCSPQKAFGFVEYGTRRCPSSSDRGVGRYFSFFSKFGLKFGGAYYTRVRIIQGQIR